MRYKLTICVFLNLSVYWGVVAKDENVFLTYHYDNFNNFNTAVCDSKREYVVRGENVYVDLKYIETLSYASCSLLREDESVLAAKSFQLLTTIYRSELKPAENGLYQCLFHINSAQKTNFAPIVKVGNDGNDYIEIKCIFTLKVIPPIQSLLNVIVNDNTLVPSAESGDKVKYAYYRYAKNEHLKIFCTMRSDKALDHANAKVTLTKNGFDMDCPDTRKTNFTFRCVLSEGDNILEIYNIHFSPAVSLGDVTFEGLLSDKVVYKQNYNRQAFYKYNEIEEIELKCSSNCLKGYCKMELWYNGNMVNYTTLWTANLKITVSQPIILTRFDNFHLIKCGVFRKSETDIISEEVYVFLWQVTDTRHTTSIISPVSTTQATTANDLIIPTIVTAQPTTIKAKENHGDAMPTQTTTAPTTTAPTTIAVSTSTNVGVAENSQAASKTSTELDTGAIVGNVVAVLILLIAVFLAVFAFATDRWCFAGRGRDCTKNSGESSETESAVGGRERFRLANLGARMRAVLPRAKDKVQVTELQNVDTEDEPLSEDKKSVVYVELALGDQTLTENPRPPSTEYAEIVYIAQPVQREAKE